MTNTPHHRRNRRIIGDALLFVFQWLVGWTLLTIGVWLALGRHHSVIWLVVPVLAVFSLFLVIPRLMKEWEGDVVDIRVNLTEVSPPGKEPAFHDDAVAIVRTRAGKTIEMQADQNWTIGDHIVKEPGEFNPHKAA